MNPNKYQYHLQGDSGTTVVKTTAVKTHIKSNENLNF